jgi:hypothetical protein
LNGIEQVFFAIYSNPKINTLRMKKFYALREMTFGYNDEIHYPVAINKIYKNYDTLEAAQKAKNELHIQAYRFEMDIDHLTKDYAVFIQNLIGINHLDFLKKQYSIDFEGLLESEYLKDFKYKNLVGWLSVELFENILEDRANRLPLPKRESLRSQVQLMQFVYREQKRSMLPFSWRVNELLYPTYARDGKYTNCSNKTGAVYYEYAATHFKIDFPAIWASKYFKKFKYKEFLDELFANFFWTLVSQSDKAILDWVEKDHLKMYEIMEVTEKTVFYKIYTNPHFGEYSDNYQIGVKVESDYLYDDHDALFFYNHQQALKEMSRFIYYQLDSYDYTGNALTGTLEELSEMPALLEAYILGNERIKYDSEKKCLWLTRTESVPDELIIGLISLIRPNKLPYKLVEIPIAQMEERYFTLEKEREWRRASEQEQKRRADFEARNPPLSPETEEDKGNILPF